VLVRFFVPKSRRERREGTKQRIADPKQGRTAGSEHLAPGFGQHTAVKGLSDYIRISVLPFFNLRSEISSLSPFVELESRKCPNKRKDEWSARSTTAGVRPSTEGCASSRLLGVIRKGLELKLGRQVLAYCGRATTCTNEPHSSIKPQSTGSCPGILIRRINQPSASRRCDPTRADGCRGIN